MALTSRERLLRVLRHERTDRLPIVPTSIHPWHWCLEFDDYHPIVEVAKKHCDFFVSIGGNTGFLYGDPTTCERRSERRNLDDGIVETTTTIVTPKGDLTSVRRRMPDSGNWRMKAFVENEDDLDRLLSIPYRPFEPDLSGFFATREKIGDAGLAYYNGFSSPVTALGGMMSEDFRPVFFFTQPDRLRTIVETLAERAATLLAHLLKAGAGPVFRWYAMEPFTEPMMPPSFTDEFIVPYDTDLIRMIHDAGCYAIHHCHGRLGAAIERMVRVGYDGVDCVESPPANNVTLAEMFARAATAAGRDRPLFLWGYIQMDDLEHKSGDQIERQVAEAIEVGGTDGRYVLGQAASPYMAHVPPQMQANWIRMIEVGARLGR